VTENKGGLRNLIRATCVKLYCMPKKSTTDLRCLIISYLKDVLNFKQETTTTL
jgi:hypothetical protein